MVNRTCRICGEDKPLTVEHFTLRRESGKYRSECNPCRSMASAVARYGITVGDVEAMKEAQGNCCAICGEHADDISHNSFKHNPLVIDHCHKTGKVRGLLCSTCNHMLGHAKDSPQILAAAISYLSH